MSLLDKALKELKEMDFAFGGSQGPDEGTARCGGEVGVEDVGKLVSFQRLRNQQEEEEVPVQKEDGQYIITMDVPFLTRILEVTRENIKDDAQLHELLERLMEVSHNHKTLTMEDYEEFREFEGEEDMEPDMEGGDEYPNPEEDQALEADPEADMEEDNEDIYSTGPISIESLLADKMTEASAYGFKHPKTQNERKAASGGGVRAKRRSKNLPNAYDDKPTSQPGKSWKTTRKNQYRVKK